jgi:hypothetical protein
MELLGDVVHCLRQTYNRLKKHFICTRWVLLHDEAQVVARFISFGDSANV